MLYLEDYLEMIENLPMEMRDRFTEMREMDLQVENNMDRLALKMKQFFMRCAANPTIKQDWKDEQMSKMRQEFIKTLEHADEKVQIATQMYELVERHLRKLDQEVSKFKMELEADNCGITEILEHRANEPERPVIPLNNHKPEKRKHSALRTLTMPDRPHQSSADLLRDTSSFSLSTKSNSSTASSPATAMFESAIPKLPVPQAPAAATSVNYNLGQVGSGSNAAIAVAASRAIGATLEMQQGRRSASLKASYVAVSKNFDLTKDINLNRELSAAGSSNPKLSATVNKLTAADSLSVVSSKSSTKKKSRASNSQQQQYQLQQQQQQQLSVADQLSVTSGESLVDDKHGAAPASTWHVDPNEPRYCLCNDVSYGDMVGCDNPDCPLEWFHYGCVGLLQAPRGKWFCPQCITSMKRRGRK